MTKHHISADSIYEGTMKKIAPLPCQKEYLRQLSAIMSFHLHRNELLDSGMANDELPAATVVVVAPTGQGKTFLLRKMAEQAHINCIVVDGSSLAAEGWRGASLGQQLLYAKEKVKDDSVFERSILFIDEMDKMRFWGTNQDQGNPTNNLLQLFNGGYYVAEDAAKNVVSINVQRFTVLLGGAFTGIEEIIRERIMPKGRIGFTESERRIHYTPAELIQMVSLGDLKEFGISKELLGRVGSILTISPMEIDDFNHLLRADTGSAQFKYDNYLRKLYGVHFEIKEEGSQRIAEKCMQMAIGARAVNPMINDLMWNAICEVERNQKICKVILDTGEEGLEIRFEYGLRKSGLYTQHSRIYTEAARKKELQYYTIRANNLNAMVNKLCRYHKNAGGEAYQEPELQVFLRCALLYMFAYTKVEEHTLNRLIDLARIANRKGSQKSAFEKMVASKIGGHDFYLDYGHYYHPELQQHLMCCLLTIKHYMIQQNGHMEFILELKHR